MGGWAVLSRLVVRHTPRHPTPSVPERRPRGGGAADLSELLARLPWSLVGEEREVDWQGQPGFS